MSEDLVQAHSHPVGRFSYLRLGATTLGQLRRSRYVRGRLTPEEEGRKPDGIIFLPRGRIKAVVEVKTPSELTDRKLPAVIEKYSPIAAAVCNLLIITDGKKTYWINPHTQGTVRGDGQPIREDFFPRQVESRQLSEEASRRLAELVEQCDQVLTADNDDLQSIAILDPSQLAETVWQKIWITTGKEPEKCLYNVVEVFVFKFLSDTGVLTGTYSFRSVIDKLSEGSDVALDHYARMVRPKIRELFPAGSDRTTIINGTIFVNERNEPNTAQAQLFGEVIQDFQDFDDKNGSMRSIDRQFKTRLYESFLRQSAGVKSLGQYFTPRNVVQAMVRMSGADSLHDGARICDPFCGVGGFVLEAIAENANLLRQFEPENGRLDPKIHIRGYDKGSEEKEDDRTIILAKANMLIYFSDLLGRYNSPEYLREFSEHAFNAVFRLLRTNLGTFAVTSDEPYDLILTNPPYVTSGSRSLRNAIDAAGLKEYYPPIGRGTEALAIQWIVANLKPGGRALVIVPDGLMNQTDVLQRIKSECEVQSIVALPSRTFFSTPKKTYILQITKKTAPTTQNSPIFTYLVSEIGESRDARRIPIPEDDLMTMLLEYRTFVARGEQYSSTDPRAKTIAWTEFDAMSQWLVERRWSPEERRALGLEDEPTEVDEPAFHDMIARAISDLTDYLREARGDED